MKKYMMIGLSFGIVFCLSCTQTKPPPNPNTNGDCGIFYEDTCATELKIPPCFDPSSASGTSCVINNQTFQDCKQCKYCDSWGEAGNYCLQCATTDSSCNACNISNCVQCYQYTRDPVPGPVACIQCRDGYVLARAGDLQYQDSCLQCPAACPNSCKVNYLLISPATECS